MSQVRKDMMAVLNAHARLNSKAIEKVDVVTARANPTIADAVNVVLKQQGKSAKPENLVPGVSSMATTVKGAPHLQLIDAKLAGMAPVTLINARIDPLRSDGSMMEAALKKANVPVERREYDGVTHEFFGTAVGGSQGEGRSSLRGSAPQRRLRLVVMHRSTT